MSWVCGHIKILSCQMHHKIGSKFDAVCWSSGAIRRSRESQFGKECCYERDGGDAGWRGRVGRDDDVVTNSAMPPHWRHPSTILAVYPTYGLKGGRVRNWAGTARALRRTLWLKNRRENHDILFYKLGLKWQDCVNSVTINSDNSVKNLDIARTRCYDTIHWCT